MFLYDLKDYNLRILMCRNRFTQFEREQSLTLNPSKKLFNDFKIYFKYFLNLMFLFFIKKLFCSIGILETLYNNKKYKPNALKRH